MQGLSAVRVAHCCSSFGGRSPRASPAPNQQLLLLGCMQKSSLFTCGTKVFAPATRRLKSSLQDGASAEGPLPLLAEEEALTNLAEEEVSTKNVTLEEGPTVTVKFILEKKCHFGQRFNVVGNDPLFGDWEVEAAIPMKWTDGDIWTLEVDVPAEKEVEFKFLLSGETGEVEWQPGSNRVFNTVEGISPLVVNEVWATAEEAAAVAAAAAAAAAAEEAAAVAATVEPGEELSNPAEDTTSSDAGGLLVPADIDVAKDEVVKALESKIDDMNVYSNLYKSGEAAPEVPLAELDLAATAVRTAVGVDGTA